ncbi:MAG: ergothioneine biosynthesis protein EgtB [Planctomycetota bacterium]|nr:ergothioneine biosynthesis protein EgtB [Planctomycetaceae bacterium]MDQ3329152.1 ergothioneine biosynthesis protein EgtB [Planctomycetota bacterium]
MSADAAAVESQPVDSSKLAQRYDRVRWTTEALVEPLSPEDCVVQSMPDASPAKWHLAHTTWFFEAFLLTAKLPGYQPFHPQFSYLFNSYYNAIGERHPRAQRGLLTRPSLDEILDYRAHVDRHMNELLAPGVSAEMAALVEVGLHHEQQHQELLLTDIKHLLSCSPLRPAYREELTASTTTPAAMSFVAFDAGVRAFGHGGEGFCYDNEQPRHRQYLHPFAVADRLVTNAEWQAFIDDGGYTRPEFWLSDGSHCITSNGWTAPMYWERIDGAWHSFTLAGMREIDPVEPVSHVSFYEADAFARWSGKRLPTEFEWELASENCLIEGNFLDDSRFHPIALDGGTESADSRPAIAELYGDVWEWTASPYVAYPGYKPPEGALGEYNGKFMSNQMVLRGGSCATPQNHIRPTYRNFFQPSARWQFMGVRLAENA